MQLYDLHLFPAYSHITCVQYSAQQNKLMTHTDNRTGHIFPKYLIVNSLKFTQGVPKVCHGEEWIPVGQLL